MSEAHHDRGFVLFTVLVAVVALSALAVLLLQRNSGEAANFSIEASRIEADSAADAGIDRILSALGDPKDPLTNALSPYRGSIGWKFGGATERLQVRAESGKLDVLFADRSMIEFVVRSIIKDPNVEQRVLATVDTIRRQGVAPDSLLGVFPTAIRLLPVAHSLDDDLTMFSGLSGVDPLAATPIVRDALIAKRPDLRKAMDESVRTGFVASDLAAGMGNLIDQPRPLYAIEATARLDNGVTSRRGALVTADMSKAHLPHVERTYDLPAP